MWAQSARWHFSLSIDSYVERFFIAVQNLLGLNVRSNHPHPTSLSLPNVRSINRSIDPSIAKQTPIHLQIYQSTMPSTEVMSTARQHGTAADVLMEEDTLLAALPSQAVAAVNAPFQYTSPSPPPLIKLTNTLQQMLSPECLLPMEAAVSAVVVEVLQGIKLGRDKHNLSSTVVSTTPNIAELIQYAREL